MDIKAIGKKTIALLVEKGLVRTPADLYQLRYSDIRALEGFKDLSTQNILRGIQQSKERPFDRLLFGLGIPHVGEVVAAKVVQRYPTIEALVQAEADDLKSIPDIGEEIAASLIAYFQDAGNLQLIESLKQAGLTLSRTEPPLTTTKQPLAGKHLVISGTFDQFEREQLKDLIKAKGGTLLTAVSGQVDYLIAGHNPGPTKLAKAQDLAIAIINEETILKMLEL
jgi:DNA ligase (NAD+)